MKRVLIRGPLLSCSGYGVHSRQIFQFCETQKDWDLTTQVLSWGITPWCINGDFEDGIYGRIMEKSNPFQGKFDITIQIQLPHEWDPALGNYNIGISAGVETDRCPLEWGTVHREKMDLVIMPSSHARHGIVTAGSGREKTPVKIVPEAFFSELMNEPTVDPLADLPTTNNFLIVGTLISDDPAADRKNLVASIKWFLEEFKESDDVGLIVKTTKGRDTSIDREMVRKLLRQIKGSVHKASLPRVYMLHGSMSREEMTNLYKSPKLTALVSATRGEGFGLPMVEAGAAGLPIIATDWSAHTEFLTGGSFLKVRYDLVHIPQSRIDGTIFVRGAKWAEARAGNFKKKLVKALADQDQLRNEAKTLATSLQASHSLESIFKKYAEAMPEVVG